MRKIFNIYDFVEVVLIFLCLLDIKLFENWYKVKFKVILYLVILKKDKFFVIYGDDN